MKNKINIADQINLSANLPLDYKVSNVYYDDETDTFVVESIADYLIRLLPGYRVAGQLTSILFTETTQVVQKANYATEIGTYPKKFYYFKDGIADINFVEIEFGGGITEVFVRDNADFTALLDLYYKLGGVDYLITTLKKIDGIVWGGKVSLLSGMSVVVEPTAYFILGNFYSTLIGNTADGIVTHDAADTVYRRFDRVVANDLNNIVIKKGIPAENPFPPEIDPTTEVDITTVLIEANATTPSGITSNVLYNENAVGEWVITSSGVNYDADYAVDPKVNLKCLQVQSIGNGDTLTLTSSVNIDVTDFKNIIFYNKLAAIMTTQHSLLLQFLNTGVAASEEVVVPLNKSQLTWQNVSIALSNVKWTLTQFNQLRFKWRKSGAAIDHAGFYLDLIKLETGFEQPVISDSIVLTGDVIATGKTGTPISTSLKNIIAAGQYGSSTKTLSVQIDTKGRVIAISENDIEPGADGREVEFSTQLGYVVWRYVGETEWNNLYLVPQDGDDGYTPYIQSGYWWINSVNTGVPATGANGRGITSIVLHSTVGKVKTYRITFTDSTTFDYSVTDGNDGTNGTKPIQVTGITVVASGWTADGDLYKYTISNVNITSTSIVEVIPDDTAYDILVVAKPMSKTVSATGTVTIKAKSVPTSDYTVTLNIYETI